MGCLSEKAENALEHIRCGYIRLAPVGDGLIEHLFDDDLETMKALSRRLERVADAELLRRRVEEGA